MKFPRRAVFPAAFSIVPRRVLGGAGHVAPSDKLNIAAVGVGGMGSEYLKGCDSENVVALCDVDQEFAAHVFQRYPAAARYRDFRVMLEKEKSIDAVIVGAPDHAHAVVAATAMKLGKHVYCAKPMTRTVHEARTLARLARERRVATQMSVQSCASDPACTTEEWIKAGAVGKVREVHVWTDRPVWPQGLKRPADQPPVPAHLDWDLWLGPAPVRPYHPAYHPFVWRGWVDFGTCGLGDMACHAFHVVFRALDLGAPLAVHASTSRVIESSLEMVNGVSQLKPKTVSTPETFPHAAAVTWDFPGGLRMHWYEGGIRPPRPAGMPAGQRMESSGMIFVGDQGTLVGGFSGGPRAAASRLRAGWEPPAKTVARTAGHYLEWIAAAKGGPAANCEFGFASKITECALLGVAAIRTGAYLEWDGAAGRFAGETKANDLLSEPYRAGWSL
jgi:predicted dehydrogenase